MKPFNKLVQVKELEEKTKRRLNRLPLKKKLRSRKTNKKSIYIRNKMEIKI